MVPGRPPYYLTRVFGAYSDRQWNLLPVEPQEDLPDAAHLGEFAEHQLNGRTNSRIRALFHATVWTLHKADRHTSYQCAPLSHLLQCCLTASAEVGDFHLADRPFHAEDHAIIDKARIVHSRSINQQYAHHAAEFQQCVPLTAIASQPRCSLDAEDRTYLAVANRVQEALNALEPLDREVLTLRHFEMLSNEETAAVLGLRKSAASNRYVRALRRLKEALGTLPGWGG